jgi:pyruvate/2-oxoglutarate dehydrogenase complex dihydrolipoamide dehydrogenase (E3) component
MYTHEQVKSVVLPDGTLGRSSEQLFPYGIYTIPEISMVGKTEAQLTAEGVSYEIGVADYQVCHRHHCWTQLLV